jgi:hypothetical protein
MAPVTPLCPACYAQVFVRQGIKFKALIVLDKIRFWPNTKFLSGKCLQKGDM